VFGVDSTRRGAVLLRTGDNLKRQRGFFRWTTDRKFYDAGTRQSAIQRRIERREAGRHGDTRPLLRPG